MPIRVAIIGAGVSGLISIKQCLDDDIEPVCFEAQGHIGGQWRYTEPDPETGEVVSSIYRSIVINTSRDTMCMSDFPMDPKEYPIYPHHTKVYKYFESYAAFFNLYPYIRFHHRVLSVTPLLDNKWLVQTKSSEGRISEEVFDAVFACSGHHSKPSLPEWEGVEAFKKSGGEVLHSHYYRDLVPYIGKNVAVIGIGNSGVDICSELSSVSNEMHLITRSGAWVWPRFIFGRPYESLFSRFFMRVVPAFIAVFIAQWILVIANGAIPTALKPKHKASQAHPTIRSDLFERIQMGTIKPHRAEISRFTENGIELTNGERIEPLDTVVACTGYQFNFPYLAHEIYQSTTDKANWVHLYNMITPPEYPTLFFIGLVQPLGAIMPVCEQQTRWATSVLHGHNTLPPKPAMHEHIEEYKLALSRNYISSPRHTVQVDYLAYNDSLAQDIGNDIRVWKFFQTFGFLQGLRAMMAVYFGLPSPGQYRLFGTGCKSEFARLHLGRLYKGLDIAMSERERREVEKFRKADK